jgi:hypothetical protein
MATLRTRTVKPSGGDYTSLVGWEAGEEADIVALDEVRRAECYAMVDTSPVMILGWTVDSTRYPEIFVPTTERHDGKWNTSKYRMSVTDAIALDIRANYFRVYGLQAENVSPAGNAFGVVSSQGQAAGADLRYDNCIVRSHADSGFVCTVLANQDDSVTLRIKNCVFHDRTNNSGSRTMSVDSTSAYIYNCILSTLNATAIRGFSGTINLKNCAILPGSGVGIVNSGATWALTNCISTDSSADDFGGSGNQVDVTLASMQFTDSTNTDFHISSESTLKDQGVDLSADSGYSFSDDINGEARSGTWDVGPDEFGAGEGPPPTSPPFITTVQMRRVA